MNIRIKLILVMLVLTVGACYYLYKDVRKRLPPSLQTSKHATVESEVYIGRKLLALDFNVNEKLLGFESDSNSLNEEKPNNENVKEVSKNSISYKNFDRNRMKRLSRGKRDTHHPDFGWKLSLNVTNNQNPPKEVSNWTSENDLISKSGKEKFLNMAVQMEGASSDNSFKELHQAWNSLGLLLRRLYEKNVSLKENTRDIKIETSTEQDLMTEKPTEKSDRERKPKFLFGLINIGNSETPTEEVQTPGIADSFESVTSPKTDVSPKEEPISTKVTPSTNSTGTPMIALGFPEPISVESTALPVMETFMGFESTGKEFNTQFVEEFERSFEGSDNDLPIETTTSKSENSFTSDQLKEFCINLLSRIHVSPKSIDQFSEENGSGELDMMNVGDKEITEFQMLSTEAPKELTTKSTNQRFGIWASIWNRFVGRRLIQHPDNANLSSPSSSPKNDINLKKPIDSTGTFSLKIESSTVSGISDFTESDQGVFNDENDESALTIPDCENFFRQIQNDAVFSKPNLLDIINNPILLSLDPSQFNFTEIVDDKQMRSMRSGSNSTDSNFEKDNFTKEMVDILNTPFSVIKSTAGDPFDEFSANELSEHTEKDLFEITVSNQDILSTFKPFHNQEGFQSGTFDKSNINNLITESRNDFSKAVTKITFLSDKLPTTQMQPFTEISDDGLFTQADIHARTDKPEISAGIDDRIFGFLNFGSGERNLDDSDSLSTQNASEFPEIRSFHPDPTNFTSSDSELIEAFTEDGLETTSNSVIRSNIFDLILNLRKEESLMNSTGSVDFDINEETQGTEGASEVLPFTKPHVKFQFDTEEKPTENQEQSNMPATQSISGQTVLRDVSDGTIHVELQSDSEEQFTESQNDVLNQTNMPAMKSLLEDQTDFQLILDDGSGDEGHRIIPGFLDFFGSGDSREFSDSPTNPELNSECLDCFKNKSSSFSFDDYDDHGSDTNDTVPVLGEETSITVNPLSNKVASDAHFELDEIYPNNKTDIFSESNQDQPKFSTVHSLKGVVSSPIAETMNYADHGNSENNGYEDTNYDLHDNFKNIDYEIPNYDLYDNFENIGYETPNYELHDNFENIGYETPNYELHDNFENIDYEIPNYELHDNYENIGNEVTNYDSYENRENYGHQITTLQPLVHIHIENECNESHSGIEAKALSTSPAVAITAPEDNLRFMDTLFLTGSGTGGLFGNDNGEINLVQEPDTTSFPSPFAVSPRQSRRGGRMDDASFVTWAGEKQEQVSEKQSNLTQSQSTSDDSQLNPHDEFLNEKALQLPEEEGRTDSISLFSTLGSVQSVEDGFNNPNFGDGTTQIFHEAFSRTVVAMTSSLSSVVIPKKKAKDLPPRYCSNAGECDIALNEGCITKAGQSVCDCRRSFVRHPETDICEAPFMLKTSLKLPAETFHEDLRNKYSELYKNKTRDAIETMWLVVYQDPTWEYNIADIDVAGFDKGSLVIHWELIFAVKKNGSILEIVQEIDEKLEETFKHEDVLKSAPLNVENAQVVSFSDINSCEKKELNYCSPNADCIRNGYRGFRCRCKEGYADNSKNPMYPGEICTVVCPQDYCGENGYCEVRLNGQKQCLCNSWYFGEKCTVSGILVISCFAGANVILVIIVLAVVCFFKRRRQRRTRFYENNQIMFQPNQELGPFGRVSPRLAASIALDELGPTKTSKFMAISTPMYMKPDIQITSPSIIGSSISYDYDSTFDRTPSAEINMEPPKYDSVPVVTECESAPQV